MSSENSSFLKKFEEYKNVRDEYTNKLDKMKKIQNKNEKDLNCLENLREDYGLKLLMVNNEYEKLIERQGNRIMTQFLKYSDSKETILQNFDNCIKLFNLNEDPNNIETKISFDKSESGGILESHKSDTLESSN